MPIMPESDDSGFNLLMPPPMNAVSYPVLTQNPSRGYVGDTYFTGLNFKTYGTAGTWNDLAYYIGTLPALSIYSFNFASAGAYNVYASAALGIYGGSNTASAGTSQALARADHKHPPEGLAQIGTFANPTGNTWYGYQSQQLGAGNLGGWSFQDFTQTFMSASNVGMSILQDIAVGVKKDAFQYYDFNSNITFRIGASGQTVIGSSSATISNAALTIRPIASTFPALIIRAVSSQSNNLQEWQTSAGASIVAINASGNFILGNLSAHPPTPVAGGLLYASAGALVYRGTTGTITQIAPA